MDSGVLAHATVAQLNIISIRAQKAITLSKHSSIAMVQFSSVDMAVGSIRAGQTDVNIGSLKINIFNHCYKKAAS